jgi:predicted glycosyltransferase
MGARGLLDVCHPDDLTPDALGEWLARDVVRPSRSGVDLAGLDRLPALVSELSPRTGRGEALRAA